MKNDAISFRAKVEEMIYAGRDMPEYRYVRVPQIKKTHCDMSYFRNHPKFGSYANSDMFQNMLKRHVPALAAGSMIRLDNLPAGVTVDTSGFLAKVCIAV
jgi:hypothetical protein